MFSYIQNYWRHHQCGRLIFMRPLFQHYLFNSFQGFNLIVKISLMTYANNHNSFLHQREIICSHIFVVCKCFKYKAGLRCESCLIDLSDHKNRGKTGPIWHCYVTYLSTFLDRFKLSISATIFFSSLSVKLCEVSW